MGRKRNKKVADVSTNNARVRVSSWRWIIPNATVFTSSACIMIIELAAGRIISRHLGSSVYTWTSVIGIVLAGIAVGNYIGGMLADRYSSSKTLANVFMCAAVATAAISLLDRLATDWSTLWMLSWPVRVACHVGIAFFFPTAVLGMISPIVAKMALDVGRQKGRTIGDIYAWGVVGSILGTFLAGFYLIAAFGTSGVVCGVAGVLVILAVLFRVNTWKTWTVAAAIALLSIVTNGQSSWASSWGERLHLRDHQTENILLSNESQYSHVQIVQTNKDPDMRAMFLDTLLHSQIDIENPAHFQYEYEKIYSSITARMRPDRLRVDSLIIGGGGYVYPRYMAAQYPGSRTDVAEIDPAVTDAAIAAFGMPEDAAINFYHEDGRVLIDRLLSQKKRGQHVDLYDFIYCDAVNDYNVPYQLTTLEFMQAVRQLIKPDGAYLMNMIDIFDSGRFLGALVNTMKEVFPTVYVFVEGIPVVKSHRSRNTFIIAGFNQPFNTRKLGPLYDPDCKIFTLTEDEMQTLRQKSDDLVLTDSFSPVENLLTEVVKESSLYKAAGEWLLRSQKATEKKQYDKAIEICQQGLRLIPDILKAPLMNQLGNVYREKGDYFEAIAKYQKVLQGHPTDIEAQNGLIQCYSATGEKQQALSHYESVLKYRPFDTITRYNYGRALLELKRYQDAIAQFSQVAKIRPKFAGNYNNWGTALYHLGDLDGAIEQFKRSLVCDSKHPTSLYNLANVYYLSKQYKKAETAFRAYIKQNPDDPHTYVNLGNSQFSQRDAAGALNSYEKALAISPNDVQAHFGRGNAFAALGRLEDAIRAYRTVLKLNPSDPEAKRRLEDIQKRHGQAANQ